MTSRSAGTFFLISWGLIPALVFLDQWSKNLIIAAYLHGESVELLGDLLRFTRVHNPGAAFGIMQDMPLLFTVLTGFAIVFVTVHKVVTEDRSWSYQLALSLILSGAIGNMTDRLKFNHVVDFIDIGFGDSRWPAFNVADSCISIGVTLLLVTSFFPPSPAADAARNG